MKFLYTLALPAILAGCAPAYVPSAPPAGHPASPEAAAAPEPPAEGILSKRLAAELDVRSRRPSAPAAAGEAGPMHGREGLHHGGAADTAAAAEPAAGAALPPAAARALEALLDAYLAIGRQLAADSVTGLEEPSRRIGRALEALAESEMPGRPHFWHERAADLDTLRVQAGTLAAAGDLHTARLAYGRLSDALERIVRATGAPPAYGPGLRLFVCGMFREAPRDGVWLQLGDEPRNPYQGSRMPMCHAESAPVPGANAAPAGPHSGEHGEPRSEPPPPPGEEHRGHHPEGGH